MDFDQTPAALGFYMPAESDPHERCWMSWPCRKELWGSPDALVAARRAYARVAGAIADFEPVTVLARPEDAGEAKLLCGRRVDVIGALIDDSWLRDNGPIFVVDGKDPQARNIAGVDWAFNAWGHKYQGFTHDDAVPRGILEHLNMKRFEGPMVLEGGAVLVDGEGTLLTTEECLLNPNRNPNLEKAQIEERLAFFLGVQKIIWLPEGYADDETDGHVDNIAAFVRPGCVALNMPSDPGDPNHARMKRAETCLASTRDAAGRTLEVVAVPQPPPRFGADGRRIPLSYLNFYLANDAVIMPLFEGETDVEAAAVIGGLFPDRQVVQVPALDIVVGGGGIHCITQQQPKGRPVPQRDRP